MHHIKKGEEIKVFYAQKLFDRLPSATLEINKSRGGVVYVLKGKPNEIESISINIGGLKGVKFARLTKAFNVL
jgi:metal-responsive CopG/Arc/MetJ family transcriptional regulator